MAMPALSVGAGTAPVLDVESMLLRLPAEARARVAWARKPIEEALAELRSGPLTDALVSQAADRIMTPLQAISRAAWVAFATNMDEYRAALMQDFQREESRLSAFVGTDPARDTLSWIVSLLQSFYGLTSAVPVEAVGSIDDAMWAEAARAPEMKALWHGLVALMAAAEEAKLAGEAERARDLLDVAFLELTEFRNVIRRQGVPFPLFPFETTDERRRRLRHYAEQLRTSLTGEDIAALDDARVRSLR